MYDTINNGKLIKSKVAVLLRSELNAGCNCSCENLLHIWAYLRMAVSSEVYECLYRHSHAVDSSQITCSDSPTEHPQEVNYQRLTHLPVNNIMLIANRALCSIANSDASASAAIHSLISTYLAICLTISKVHSLSLYMITTH